LPKFAFGRLRVKKVFLVAEWTSADPFADRPNPPRDPFSESAELTVFTVSTVKPCGQGARFAPWGRRHRHYSRSGYALSTQ